MDKQAKNEVTRAKVYNVVGKMPHTVLVGEKDTTAKVTVAGIVTNNELKGLMEIGEVSVARSGANVGISIKIAHPRKES